MKRDDVISSENAPDWPLFVHPVTKIPLRRDSAGNLRDAERPDGMVFENHDGSYDFTVVNRDEKDKDYYDRHYRSGRRDYSEFIPEKCRNLWNEEAAFAVLLRSVGNVSGRKILLLGNGVSLKELYFWTAGADVVYTDISMQAVTSVKSFIRESSAVNNDGYGRIQFHGADAVSMPFPDATFDLIYGCAFVHHLDDLDRFFREVRRCLKPGGICRFLDDAYSPVWQRAKSSLLVRPLQRYSHKKGISPEDRRATKKGGFRLEEITDIARRLDFEGVLFERLSFFEYLFRRGMEKLGGKRLAVMLPFIRAVDSFIHGHTGFMKHQGIRLVWGFQKPGP